jgi:putative transposase
MYEYRNLKPEEKAILVAERLEKGYPPHSPPHPIQDREYYLLTAACYEHQNHLHSPLRRQYLLDLIFDLFINNNIEIRAWVILPNHYHLLVHLDDFKVLGSLFQRIHGNTSRTWNLEDKVTKRKVWYSWSDRAIRSERHYYTTINYIHYNPIKHDYTTSGYEWEDSSVHWYLAEYGKQWLRDSWLEYPIKDYGKEWDNFDICSS